MSKGTFWIVGVVVFLSRVFVSTKEMMMATPTMQHAPATTTPVAVEVRGIVVVVFLFL